MSHCQFRHIVQATICIGMTFYVMSQSGCERPASQPAPRTPEAQLDQVVLTTTEPAAFLARRMLRDAVPVECIRPDEPAHNSSWKPDSETLRRLQRSQLVVLNGAGLEPWSRNAALPRSRLVRLSESSPLPLIYRETITHSHGPSGSHSHELPNPYTWLDPALLRHHAEQLKSALDRAFPGAVRPDAWNQLGSELDALDVEYREAADALAAVTLSTDGDRLDYLVRALSANDGVSPRERPTVTLRVHAASSSNAPQAPGIAHLTLADRAGADLLAEMRANLAAIRMAARADAGSP